MRRADRLFALVQQLRVRRFATAEQLAETLEVSVRTVYRDVRDLVYSGVPIQGEAGVGYRLERGFELPPLTFTAEELEALILGARFVASQADPELSAAAKTAMARITAALPRPLYPILTRTHLFVPSTQKVRRRATWLAPLRRAMATHNKVQLHYCRADGQHSVRVVHPIALYFWGDSWSLAAWCELRQSWRNFRSDRIDTLTETGERFEVNGDHNLQAYLAATRAAVGPEFQLPGAGAEVDPWAQGIDP
ncbi:MAG: YafY family transcriptional regulator [Myxococcales bacterium]|nr:YafY family transcriptional regulator [Myxococcales bacterium]